ncbi:crossover junction endodeoxyribonuclease RuvC [Opitutales bacterium ASA1]|uniref:crossover junction endodeoxyribonuclease RuvC n=1 Tax=Congregicoccus parvus TaxID=3081749 RepID=UPI002B2F718F|nr:crossover junction endodeoxyribonuclease RuvC [Opitutales bacterium ASA1]
MGRTTTRDLWKAKLEGRLAPALDLPPVFGGRRNAFVGNVLGVDPSLRGTGLAVLEFATGRPPLLLHSRTLKLGPSRSMAECLGAIFTAMSETMEMHAITHVALEQTIYVQNFQTAQILGAARGAAIAAAAVRTLPVFEYAPLRVKQAVVGVGRASKEQMARTVMSLLGHGRTLALDEADAAGVALCHAFTWRG